MNPADRLENILRDHFGINSKDGSYTYRLNREKRAFIDGTMTFDDFTPYGDDEIEELVELLVENDIIVKTGRWAYGDEMPDYPRVRYTTYRHYCTACANKALVHNDEEILTDCCPNCGARMEG